MERSSAVRESLAALLAARWWGEVSILPEVGSTNVEVQRLGADWSAVVAERQTAGRGRRGRAWDDGQGHGIACSVLVPLSAITALEAEAGVEGTALGWVPLATGLAVRDCLERLGVEAALKWPNDVLVSVEGDERKICGILCEVVPGGPDGPQQVVVGIGINLSHDVADLPVPHATSLRLVAEAAGRPAPSREEVVPALLEALRDRLDPLDLESVRRDYRLACVTIGREVDVHLPDGTVVRRFAETVDDDGRLRVVGDGASATVSAGDVHHVRHQPSP